MGDGSTNAASESIGELRAPVGLANLEERDRRWCDRSSPTGTSVRVAGGASRMARSQALLGGESHSHCAETAQATVPLNTALCDRSIGWPPPSDNPGPEPSNPRAVPAKCAGLTPTDAAHNHARPNRSSRPRDCPVEEPLPRAISASVPLGYGRLRVISWGSTSHVFDRGDDVFVGRVPRRRGGGSDLSRSGLCDRASERPGRSRCWPSSRSCSGFIETRST